MNKNIKNWLNIQKKKSLLKFLTCGSVDDGKSTLIGRLLYEKKQIYKDHIDKLKKNSQKYNTVKKIDLSLLTDGLQAEIEQGITIDVAYKYFSTDLRKFIIADTPGHVQYTKNMATGASNCDLAIILVDSRKGIVQQTKRHSFIVTLFGIKHLIVAINKMDLIENNKQIFEKIKHDYTSFAKKLSTDLKIIFIPISAVLGINITSSCGKIPWYKGKSLLDILETIEINQTSNSLPLRLPIQYVIRSNSQFRGYAGTIESGTLYKGQKIKVLPSQEESIVEKIITFDKDLKQAVCGQSVALVLKDNIDISRGDLIISIKDINITLTCEAKIYILWMSKTPLYAGKYYKGKIAGKINNIFIKKIYHQIDINNFDKVITNKILINNIALICVVFNDLLPLDLYKNHKVTGSMIIIDLFDNSTLGAGIIESIKNKKNKKKHNFTQFEIDLYKLITNHFPHWNIKNNIT